MKNPPCHSLRDLALVFVTRKFLRLRIVAHKAAFYNHSRNLRILQYIICIIGLNLFFVIRRQRIQL